MSKKDPAALFYIDTWLSSTAEMDSDVRGWYLNLILHQYDKKDLPNDLEKLAVMAGVKFSEFKRFEQVFEQVLKHKFKQNDKGRLENGKAKEILMARELFKDKRVKSGTIGAVVKLAKDIKGFTDKHLQTLKNELYELDLDEINKLMDKQVLKQKLKLYINGNGNESEDINIIKERYREDFENDFNTDEKVCRENGFNHEQLAKAKTEFWNIKELDEEMTGKSFRDVQKHFLNWCRQNKSRLKKQENEKPSYKTGHDAAESAIRLADKILSGEYVPNDSTGNNG